MAAIDRRITSKGVRYRARVCLNGVTLTHTFPRKGNAQDDLVNQ